MGRANEGQAICAHGRVRKLRLVAIKLFFSNLARCDMYVESPYVLLRELAKLALFASGNSFCAPSILLIRVCNLEFVFRIDNSVTKQSHGTRR